MVIWRRNIRMKKEGGLRGVKVVFRDVRLSEQFGPNLAAMAACLA